MLPVGVLAHSTLAAADAAKLVMGPASSVVVTGLAMVAVATIANTQIMEHTRTTYALARHGMLPPALARVSASGTPRASLLVVLAATSAIISGRGADQGAALRDPAEPLCADGDGDLPQPRHRLHRVAPRRARPAPPLAHAALPPPGHPSATVNVILLVLFIAGDWKTGLCSAALLAAAFPLYAYGHRPLARPRAGGLSPTAPAHPRDHYR